MNKNPDDTKNSEAAQPVEEQIQAMMGPPPEEASPTPIVAKPESKAASENKPSLKAGDTIVPTSPDKTVMETLGNQPADNKANKSGGKIKRFFRKWWRDPKYRKLTIIGACALLIGLVLLPNSRYFMLNSVGVRSSASLTVIDNSTQLPLKNVEVSLGGQASKTDENGYAKIEHVKLGNNLLQVQKRAFATISQKVVIGWGSNPLGKFQVQPTGSQYTFLLTDWLTGKTVTDASASGGGADAQADDKGKIVLTVDTSTAQLDSLDVTFIADNYRDEVVKLDLGSKDDHAVKMVSNRKDVFISNRSGKYDVYSTYIDGKADKLVLAASGLERDDIIVVQHPTDNVAALTSSRVNARNNDGYLLNTLTLINLDDNSTRAIAQSEQIKIIGWIGRRLIYMQIQAGASASDPKRFQLISYDYKSSDKKVLASANDFNDVLLDGDQIYYAPANLGKKTSNGLIQSNADGSTTKTILSVPVWNIFRVSFDSLNLATENDFYSYNLNNQSDATKLKQSPANSKNKLYINSPDNKNSLWVDQRDGKGLLINHDIEKNIDKTLVTKEGLIYPVKWLSNDIIIYRVRNQNETADYVVSLTTGKSYKVTDLYNSAGIDRWYYY